MRLLVAYHTKHQPRYYIVLMYRTCGAFQVLFVLRQMHSTSLLKSSSSSLLSNAKCVGFWFLGYIECGLVARAEQSKWFKDRVSLILAAFSQNSPQQPLLLVKFIQYTRTPMHSISRTSALLSNL